VIVALILAQAAVVAPAPQNVRTILDEMKAEQVACGLAGADYVLFTDEPRRVYVVVPRAIYARRRDADIAAKLGCTTKVARDRGFRPVLLGRDK